MEDAPALCGWHMLSAQTGLVLFLAQPSLFGTRIREHSCRPQALSGTLATVMSQAAAGGKLLPAHGDSKPPLSHG